MYCGICHYASERNGAGQKHLTSEYFGIIDNLGGSIFVDFIGTVHLTHELNLSLTELRNIVFIIVHRSKSTMFHPIEPIE